MTCTYGFSHFRHFQNCCNRDGNTIFKYMNYAPIVVATDLEVHFSVLKKGVTQYFCLYSVCRGWTTSDFLKLTFKWWKSSRSQLVADDVINEQISLELWLKHLVQSWHMTQCCPHGYCSYSSSFWSVLSSLGRYISHRFLLVLNQIQIKLHSKDYIHMNALVRAIACVN